MTITEQFNQAQQRIETLTERPTNEEFLELYALFKQATKGDNLTKKPGLFDVKGQYKWKAWKAKAGLEQEEAMQQYADYVNMLLGKYDHK